VAVRDDLFAIAEPVVQAEGFELVELEYAKEGPRWVVRVFLFRPEGVSLEDCKLVSNALSARFEEDDPVKVPYNLEVSSPGAERVLKNEREYHIFQGRLVRITARDPVEDPATGKKEQVIHGLLGPVTGDTIQLAGPDGRPISLERDNVKQVRLALKSSVPAFK
jgi:ribosome maturation factor RimP